eukprot:m.293797 g.293797  ORF g.293797 m.293797 type:complete len:156 (+) comp32160_c0_seq1:43-510(+)
MSLLYLALLTLSCLATATELHDPSITLDNQGRMHIVNDNDVVIANVSVRAMFETVKDLQQHLTTMVEAVEKLNLSLAMERESHQQAAAARQDLVATVDALNHTLELERTTNRLQNEKLKYLEGLIIQNSADKLVADDGTPENRFGSAVQAQIEQW